MLARRVGADGRTRAYLNGRAATVGELRDLGGALMSFYGQHEHRKLTIAGQAAGTARRAVRRRAGAAAAHVRRGVRRGAAPAGGACRSCASSPARASASSTCSSSSSPRSMTRRPTSGEYDELLARRERLRRADALCSAAGARRRSARRRRCRWRRRRGKGRRPRASRRRPRCPAGRRPAPRRPGRARTRAGIESDDLAVELRAYAEGSQEGESLPRASSTLDGIEERLAALERLMRKHGGSIERVLEHAASTRARGATSWRAPRTRWSRQASSSAARWRCSTSRCWRCAARAKRPRRCSSAACASSSPRWRWPTRRSRSRSRAREAGPAGADAVEFLIAPNPGVPAGPLREIASGGELSRVMLALITAARERCRRKRAKGGARRRAIRAFGETLVFDEIDAGHRRARGTGRRRAPARARPRRASCCASPTCRRSPRSATATSRSSRTRPRARAHDASCSWPSARSSPSSCGCSAPTPTTAARAATRASCAAPPERVAAAAPRAALARYSRKDGRDATEPRR